MWIRGTSHPGARSTDLWIIKPQYPTDQNTVARARRLGRQRKGGGARVTQGQTKLWGQPEIAFLQFTSGVPARTRTNNSTPHSPTVSSSRRIFREASPVSHPPPAVALALASARDSSPGEALLSSPPFVGSSSSSAAPFGWVYAWDQPIDFWVELTGLGVRFGCLFLWFRRSTFGLKARFWTKPPFSPIVKHF